MVASTPRDLKTAVVKLLLKKQKFDDGSLQITWYSASGKRCVDGRQEDIKVFIGNGIKFTRLGGCTADYF